jgi:hypothetical protein
MIRKNYSLEITYLSNEIYREIMKKCVIITDSCLHTLEKIRKYKVTFNNEYYCDYNK